ncbi:MULTISPECIES: LWR-salt protein [Salinibaculum]|uniref:LWR-salt protein n=1 Tax=Salinibaculum TaxID=2732368 RepID=UPI0030D31A6E
MDEPDETRGTARYVFRVTVRLEPTVPGVAVDPAEFETTLSRDADPPEEEGWLFFRDNLWRGDLADADYFRKLTEEALDVPVTSVSFSELRTDDAYLTALRGAIASHLDEFNADTVDKALSTFLGSSIRVVDG